MGINKYIKPQPQVKIIWGHDEPILEKEITTLLIDGWEIKGYQTTAVLLANSARIYSHVLMVKYV